MRRTIATVGVLGLALLGTAASANAAPTSTATAFHAAGPATTSYLARTGVMPLGENLTDDSQAKPAGDGTAKGDKTDKSDKPVKSDNAEECEKQEKPPAEKPEKPPVEKPEKPPVEKPEAPPVEKPVTPPVEKPVTPPAEQPVSPPAGAAKAVPAPVHAPARVINAGFNVQTAAVVNPGNPSTGLPLWLTVLTGLFTAGAALALWRGRGRSTNSDS